MRERARRWPASSGPGRSEAGGCAIDASSRAAAAADPSLECICSESLSGCIHIPSVLWCFADVTEASSNLMKPGVSCTTLLQQAAPSELAGTIAILSAVAPLLNASQAGAEQASDQPSWKG